jgi:hypothetical protein
MSTTKTKLKCIFCSNNCDTIIGIYVDDRIIIGDHIKFIENILKKNIKLTKSLEST